MAVRTTIQLEPDLAHRLSQFVPSRGLNRFINQTLAEKVDALERALLEAEMKEGYLASNDEQDDVDADWDTVSVVDWPA